MQPDIIDNDAPQPMLSGLHGIAATCLFTLNARARESTRPDALIRDPTAVALAQRLAWDASAFDDDWLTQLGAAIRTEILDEAVAGFLAIHPGALVINLGAGFCTRFFRLDDGISEWVDVDLPPVIEAKRSLHVETRRYRLVAGSVLTPAWMDEVGAGTARRTLLIAEGLLQYFSGRQVKRLVIEIAERFSGSDMLLEVLSPTAMMLSRWQPSLRRMHVRARWGVRNSRSLESWSPRVQFVREWRYDRHAERWRWVRRIGWMPGVRALMRIVHLHFA